MNQSELVASSAGGRLSFAELSARLGKRTQVVMLDTRYFRSRAQEGGEGKSDDRWHLSAHGRRIDHHPRRSTMAPGWKGRSKKPAELRIIVSSIQFAPEAHGGECWANFPHEQKRLLSLLKGKTALVLSGDRHWCEFSPERRVRLHLEFDDAEASARHTDAQQAPDHAKNLSSAERGPFEHRLDCKRHHRENLWRVG